MTIYVDALIGWQGRAETAQGRRWFGEGKPSCHLVTDGPLEELHAFAAKIGLRRAWFQDKSLPHYDLTPGKRVAALRAGAVEITRAQFVALFRRWRARCDVCGEPGHPADRCGRQDLQG